MNDTRAIDHVRLAEILEVGFPGLVSIEHSGGGVHNPVVDFGNGKSLVFSDGWHPAEASFGYYDDTEDDPVAVWDSGRTDEPVPMDTGGILALVGRTMARWLVDRT